MDHRPCHEEDAAAGPVVWAVQRRTAIVRPWGWARELLPRGFASQGVTMQASAGSSHHVAHGSAAPPTDRSTGVQRPGGDRPRVRHARRGSVAPFRNPRRRDLPVLQREVPRCLPPRTVALRRREGRARRGPGVREGRRVGRRRRDGRRGGDLHLPDAPADPPQRAGELPDLRHGARAGHADGGGGRNPELEDFTRRFWWTLPLTIAGVAVSRWSVIASCPSTRRRCRGSSSCSPRRSCCGPPGRSSCAACAVDAQRAARTCGR